MTDNSRMILLLHVLLLYTKYSNIQKIVNILNITSKEQLIKVSLLTNFSKDCLNDLFKLHNLCTSL